MASHYIGWSYLFFWRLLPPVGPNKLRHGDKFSDLCKARAIRFESCLFSVWINIHRFPHWHFIPDNEPDGSLVKRYRRYTTPGTFSRTGYSCDDAWMRAAESNGTLNIIRTPNERNNEIDTRE